MALVGSEVNRSRWDPAYKFDSYGARVILNELFSGRLLDFGRFPVLSSTNKITASQVRIRLSQSQE
jgi:hypothetical protein